MASAKVALPHNIQAIVKEADSEIDTSSMEVVFKQLESGVFLKQKHQKCTCDRDHKAINFQIFATDLEYDGGQWIRYPDVGVEVSELVTGGRFKVTGHFETSQLSPGITYAVSFNIKMKACAEGWDKPVILKFELPNGIIVEREEDLSQKPREVWLPLVIGTFSNPSPGMCGPMKISLSSLHDKKKKGIVFREIDITATPILA